MKPRHVSFTSFTTQKKQIMASKIDQDLITLWFHCWAPKLNISRTEGARLGDRGGQRLDGLVLR